MNQMSSQLAGFAASQNKPIGAGNAFPGGFSAGVGVPVYNSPSGNFTAGLGVGHTHVSGFKGNTGVGAGFVFRF